MGCTHAWPCCPPSPRHHVVVWLGLNRITCPRGAASAAVPPGHAALLPIFQGRLTPLGHGGHAPLLSVPSTSPLGPSMLLRLRNPAAPQYPLPSPRLPSPPLNFLPVSTGQPVLRLRALAGFRLVTHRCSHAHDPPVVHGPSSAASISLAGRPLLTFPWPTAPLRLPPCL